MKNTISYILILMAVLSTSSCRTRNFLYLDNMIPGSEYEFNRPESRIHPNDRLNITVSSKSPELAVPFNSNGGAFLNISSNGNVESTTETRNASYRVDDNGYIDFPLLGRIHVKDLTTSEVEVLIKNKIISGRYINNPLVNVSFQNFRYYTLGALGGGMQTAEDGNVNIIQAISKAGGIPSGGNFKRVLVLREENGMLVKHVLDVTDKKVLKSPCYQLQQNDIIYVEPRFKKTTIEENTNRLLYAITTVTSIISTIALLFNYIKK